MHRNLDRRVEALLRVCDEAARTELHRIFDAALAPDVRCWELGPRRDWTHWTAATTRSRKLERVGELPG